ncbi:alpha/beta fold hydrolase [Streptomyces sp. NBC_01317]|uniref:alpha/beta hydrolase n=1 Tax=Streptomyces sp. NBC_01317 TaxID=2903822 RepID=UPI002E165C66|nr:alpha/beta fold hydrolase [Streptomyces sp. NBC_01317]
MRRDVRDEGRGVRRFSFPCDGETLTCSVTTPADPAASRATAVLLHGAGTSEHRRLDALAGDLAARGHTVVTFDFSGHGGSSGSLGELSLGRRLAQARAVIDAHAPPGDGLVLVGFSMSGQTVADLAAHYGPRVTTIGLCAPAVYARRAWEVPFADGFTGVIRTPDSWRDSAALDAFRTFTGRAVLLVPAHDTVIPPAVTRAVAEALATRADLTHLVHADADHKLGLWLRENAKERGEFADALLRPVQPEPVQPEPLRRKPASP